MPSATARSTASTTSLVEPGAAEDPVGVDARLRGDARADQERAARGGGVVGPRVGRAVGQHAVAGRDARDVGAVPLAVERVRVGGGDRVRRAGVGVADEVPPAGDARVGEGRRADGQAVVRREVRRVARAAEIGVVVVDAGVDDADLHPGSGEAVVAPRGGRADVGHALDQRRGEGRHAPGRDHPGQAPERRGLSGRRQHLDPVVGVAVAADDPGAGGADAGGQGPLAHGQARADRPAPPGGQHPAGAPGRGLVAHDRRPPELQHDRRDAPVEERGLLGRRAGRQGDRGERGPPARPRGGPERHPGAEQRQARAGQCPPPGSGILPRNAPPDGGHAIPASPKRATAIGAAGRRAAERARYPQRAPPE